MDGPAVEPAVEAPSAPFIAGGQEKVLHKLPSVQEPVPPSGQTLGETSFCRLGSKRGRRGLYSYCTGPPLLLYGTSRASCMGPLQLQGLTFGEGKLEKVFFEILFFSKWQNTSSYFLVTYFHINFHFQPLNPFNFSLTPAQF